MRQNLSRSRRSFALSVFGISVGIASLTFFLALSAGVRHVVLGAGVSRRTDRSRCRRSRRSERARSALFSSLSRAEAAHRRGGARARRAPEVRAAYRRAKLAFPARAWGGAEILGKNFYTELVAEGVDPRAMAGDDLGPEPFADNLGSHAAVQRRRRLQDRRRILPVGHARLRAAGAGGDLAVHRRAVQQHDRRADGAAEDRQIPRRTLARHHLQHRARPLVHRRVEVGRRAASAQGHARRHLAARRAARARRCRSATCRRGTRNTRRARRRCRRWCSRPKTGADVTRLTAAIRAAGYDIADSGAERAGLAITLVTLLFALVSFAMVVDRRHQHRALVLPHRRRAAARARRHALGRRLGARRARAGARRGGRESGCAAARSASCWRAWARSPSTPPRAAGSRFSVQAGQLLRVRLDAACRRARMLHLGLHARRVLAGARRRTARADRSLDLVNRRRRRHEEDPLRDGQGRDGRRAVRRRRAGDRRELRRSGDGREGVDRPEDEPEAEGRAVLQRAALPSRGRRTSSSRAAIRSPATTT